MDRETLLGREDEAWIALVKSFDGVPEGEYQATVVPGDLKGPNTASPAYICLQTFHVEARENTFELRPVRTP